MIYVPTLTGARQQCWYYRTWLQCLTYWLTKTFWHGVCLFPTLYMFWGDGKCVKLDLILSKCGIIYQQKVEIENIVFNRLTDFLTATCMCVCVFTCRFDRLFMFICLLLNCLLLCVADIPVKHTELFLYEMRYTKKKNALPCLRTAWNWCFPLWTTALYCTMMGGSTKLIKVCHGAVGHCCKHYLNHYSIWWSVMQLFDTDEKMHIFHSFVDCFL